jgi:hypothetical protein
VAIPLLVAIPTRMTVLAGFTVAVVLLAGFTVGIVISVRRGNQAPCRCFGRSSVPLGPRHVVRNTGLIVLALAGLAAAWTSSPDPDPAMVALAVIAGVVLGGLVTVFDDVAELLSPTTSNRKERR